MIILTLCAFLLSALFNILFIFGFKIAVIVSAFLLVHKLITDYNKKKLGGD